MAALYIGGMGARDRNFYNQLAIRYGYADAAKEIQDLYLDGNKAEAAAKVPAEFLELSNLVGPEGYVKDRLAAYKESGVDGAQRRPDRPRPDVTAREAQGLVRVIGQPPHLRPANKLGTDPGVRPTESAPASVGARGQPRCMLRTTSASSSMPSSPFGEPASQGEGRRRPRPTASRLIRRRGRLV